MSGFILRRRPLVERHPGSADEIRALIDRAEAAEAERDRLRYSIAALDALSVTATRAELDLAIHRARAALKGNP